MRSRVYESAIGVKRSDPSAITTKPSDATARPLRASDDVWLSNTRPSTPSAENHTNALVISALRVERSGGRVASNVAAVTIAATEAHTTPCVAVRAMTAKTTHGSGIVYG